MSIFPAVWEETAIDVGRVDHAPDVAGSPGATVERVELRTDGLDRDDLSGHEVFDAQALEPLSGAFSPGFRPHAV